MWKKITPSDPLFSVSVGDSITQEPNDHPVIDFIIKKIVNGYISALHMGRKNIMTYFPTTDLFSQNWWIKKVSVSIINQV
jgi:hypothetical protein